MEAWSHQQSFHVTVSETIMHNSTSAVDGEGWPTDHAYNDKQARANYIECFQLHANNFCFIHWSCGNCLVPFFSFFIFCFSSAAKLLDSINVKLIWNQKVKNTAVDLISGSPIAVFWIYNVNTYLQWITKFYYLLLRV